MRRFTILSLMGLVVALAVAIAALRNADEYWAGGLTLATPLLLGIALIGALCGKERSRAGRLGFAILGGAYFTLAFLGLSEGNLGKLPTSKLLYLVHQKVVGQQRFSVVITGTSVINSTVSTAGLATPTPIAVNVTGTSPPGGSTVSAVFDEVVALDGSPPNRWKAMLPGAADYTSFAAVGHCLFALAAGMLGAIIARRFERRRIAVGPLAETT